MSKIQGTLPNYQKAPKLTSSKVNYAQRQSFGDAKADAADLEKKIIKSVTEHVDEDFKKNPIKRVSNFFAKVFNEHDSEIQNQLINATFTSTIAPFMIAKNPFSKQDDKTKQYTALRQPISAVIAISGGVAMTEAINRFNSIMSSEGYISTLDGRMCPDKTYLTAKFKKAFKEASNKQVFLDSCKPEDAEKSLTSSGAPKGKYKKACIKGFIKQEQDKRKKLFSALIGEHPDNISINEKTGEILLKGQENPIGKNIPKLTNGIELKAYLDKNNLYTRTLGDFMKSHFGFEFYEDGRMKPSTEKGKINSINAMDFLREVGLIGDKTKGDKGEINEDELKTIISIVRQENETEGQINKAFNSGALKEDGAKILADATGQQANRMDQMHSGVAKDEKIALGQFFSYFKNKGENVQDLMNMKMDKVLDRLSKIISSQNNTKFNPKANIMDYATNIISRKASIVEKNFANYNKFTGIGFNIITTAITCTILNWAYPRVVERLFPSLVKDDAKGGNK